MRSKLRARHPARKGRPPIRKNLITICARMVENPGKQVTTVSLIVTAGVAQEVRENPGRLNSIAPTS